jgi:hypothetical protein
VAVALYASLGSDETISDREVIEHLGDSTFSVHCEACQETYTMPAGDYVRGLGSAKGDRGVKCLKCGSRKAWRVPEPVQSNPLLAGFDATQYTTIEDLRGALNDVNAKIAELRAQRDDPTAASDSKRTSAIDQELHVLYLKRSALDARWDELDSSHSP